MVNSVGAGIDQWLSYLSKNFWPPTCQDDQIKAVVFGFGQGQELSEHTAAKPAMLYFVKGEASVGLGDDIKDAVAGTFVHMPANLKHSIKAKTPVVMLLVLMK